MHGNEIFEWQNGHWNILNVSVRWWYSVFRKGYPCYAKSNIKENITVKDIQRDIFLVEHFGYSMGKEAVEIWRDPYGYMKN